MSTKTGNDLFIVDNSDDDWKVLNYLAEWSEISSRFDIATGYFEICSLLALDGKWQESAIRRATKRGIASNECGILYLSARSIDGYDRKFLKLHLMSCLTKTWCVKQKCRYASRVQDRRLRKWCGYLWPALNVQDLLRSSGAGQVRSTENYEYLKGSVLCF